MNSKMIAKGYVQKQDIGEPKGYVQKQDIREPKGYVQKQHISVTQAAMLINTRKRQSGGYFK